MQTGIIRGAAMLAGLLWLASCSSSPKSRDYTGYMTRPYTIRGHRYHPMSVEQALSYEQTGIASHYNECALWGLVSGETAIGENVRTFMPASAREHTSSLRKYERTYRSTKIM